MTKGTRAAKGGWIMLFVLCVTVAAIVALTLGGQEIGEARIIDDL